MLFSRAHLVATTPKLRSGKAQALGLKDSVKPKAQFPQVSLANTQDAKQKIREEDVKHYEECIDKLAISGYSTKIFKDEDEDGEERPDLMLDIRGVK